MSATDQQTPAEVFLKDFAHQVAELVAAKLREDQPDPARLLKIPEVAERLGISERAARDLTYSHKGQPPRLPSSRVTAGGAGVRVSERDLAAYIDGGRVAGKTT